MQGAILDPYGAAGGRPDLIEKFIKPSKRMPGRDHFGIYQMSYVARLREVMGNMFTALQYALGPELFQGFADQYLQANPSQSYTLADLGDRFGEFLEATRPDKEAPQRESWPDFMIELIHYEYVINRAFDEHADDNYNLATLETPEDQLMLIPVFYAFEYRFPIHWFYLSFKNGKAPELSLEQQSWSAITRHNYQLGLHRLSRGQFLLLKALEETQSVEAALTKVVNAYDVDAQKAREMWEAWKPDWIKAKLLRLRS